MTHNVSPEALAIIRRMQQSELDESVIYKNIASFAKGKENRRTLLRLAKEELAYIKKKQDEKMLANTFLQLGDINERQAQIIRMFIDNPNEVLTVKDVQAKFLITPTTAKSDLMGLVQRGLLAEISFNKVKKGYIKGEQFDESIKSIVQ